MSIMQRVVIEFVVEVPNADVAGDVETRISREHLARLCETFQAVTGYEPLSAPGRPGLLVATEPVTWNEGEQEWFGEDEVYEPGDNE